MQVYDGITTNSSEIGRYCGKKNPPRVVSTYNYLLVVFQSDSSISGRGFQANYSFVDIGKAFYLLKDM